MPTLGRRLGQCRVDVPEISGLAHHADRGSLFAVGDDSGAMYEIELEGEPRVRRKIALERGKKHDLEGIAVAPGGEALLVVSEKKRRILRYDLQGRLLDVVDVALDGRKKNAGIEGLTVDPGSQRIFAVNERKPLALVELNASLSVCARTEIDAFADLSGVCAHAGSLWIVSDASEALGRFDETPQGWILAEQWALPSKGAEGIAIADGRLYVAFDTGDDDEAANLAWFRLPA